MTEPACLAVTRTAYDTVAVDYAGIVKAVELTESPLDRAMLTAFAELVQAAGGGPVADLGCGPGRVTTYLDALGVSVFGVDLSPAMVEVARQTHPGLQFSEGSMTALDLVDGQLGGIVAWYSIIHTPPDLLPVVFAEFYRTLAPGGYLLAGFHVGDERRHLEQAYGHELPFDVYLLQPERVAEIVSQTGLTVTAQLVREPGEREKRPQASLLARKPVS
jgi:SAM-dependent methyltransferase